jgi:hypothetical protein
VSSIKQAQSTWKTNWCIRYKKIIKVLQKNAGQWGRIKRIFGWLVCVRRPLRRHELRAALCIIIKDDGSAHISDKRRVNMDLAELCGYLIHEVVEGFEFIHQTVEQ